MKVLSFWNWELSQGETNLSPLWLYKCQTWTTTKRGCCIMSLWLRKFCRSSYSMRTLHSWSKKNLALGIHVVKAYTEFQQYLCIIFEDMSILLSAIFIFHGLILLLEAETSEQHRCLVIMIIIPNICFMVLETTGLNPVFQRKNPFWKIFTKSWDIGKNVSSCSEISVTSNKIRLWKMKMALSKMLISSKIMHGYCWNSV